MTSVLLSVCGVLHSLVMVCENVRSSEVEKLLLGSDSEYDYKILTVVVMNFGLVIMIHFEHFE